MKQTLQRLRRFLVHDMWSMDIEKTGLSKRSVLRLLRIVVLTARGFRKDELPLRASGLTFWTLLSLGPLLAFVFSIFKGMGRDLEMIANFKESIAEMPAQVRDLLGTILTYVETSNTVGIGSMAVIILLYTVIRMMSTVEISFNRVWGITSTRPFIRKVTDYVSILVLAPMLIMSAGALSGFTSTEFWANRSPVVHATYGRLLTLSPWFAAVIAFFVLYILMPNTRVRTLPAMCSGMVAATGWLIWQKFYVNFQGMILGQQDKVFGAFASVPIFMFWLYVCWLIILFGCELAFAMQNSATYSREQQADRASHETRAMLTLAAVRAMAGKMIRGEPPLDVAAFARANRVPIRLTNDVLAMLQQAGLAAEVADAPGTYTLLRAPDELPVSEVIDVVVRDGAGPGEFGVGSLDERVQSIWNDVGDSLRQALGGLSVRALADDPDDPLKAVAMVPDDPQGSDK